MAESIVAASYERVSTRVQGQTGFSLNAQHESNEAFAMMRGWELPERLRFRDGETANASGKDWDLPGLNGMLEAATRGEFRYLIVPDRDRLARDMLKGKILEDQLRRYGVHVVYQRAPTEESPEGDLTNNVLFALAEFERAKTRWRTMNGRREKARTGRVVGVGAPPYGYRFTRETLPSGKTRVASLEPDPITAPIAARIVRDSRTISTWEIAFALTDEGIPSPSGKHWRSKVVHRIATNRTHIGEWRFGDIVVPVAPLFAEADNRTPTATWLAEWTAAQEAMSERLLRPGPRTAPGDDEYLLRGLLTCGHCGLTLRATPNGRSRLTGKPLRYYVCGCHAPARAKRLARPVCELSDVPAPAIEAEAWRMLSETLLDPAMLETALQESEAAHRESGRIQRDQRAVIDGEIARHQKDLDTLVDQLVNVTSAALIAAADRRAKELEETIATLVRRRDALVASPGAGLTEGEANAIRDFAETARLGIAEATPAERRLLFQTLRLRGRVLADPGGVLLGKKNRFTIAWEARIPLLHTASGFHKRDQV